MSIRFVASEHDSFKFFLDGDTNGDNHVYEDQTPKYHLERGNTGHSLCSSQTRLDKSAGLPIRYVSGVESCMRSGCRQGWDRVDEVATFILSERAPR